MSSMKTIAYSSTSHIMTLLFYVFMSVGLVAAFIVLLFIVVRLISVFKKSNKQVVFFHPFADAGGGGERVLWMMISILQHKGLCVVLYTGNHKVEYDMISCVKNQFNIDIDPRLLKIVLIYKRDCIHQKYHIFMTLISQGLSSLVLGVQLVISRNYLSPSTLLFDTTGLSFCYPLFKLFGMKVIPYVHYPTISSDMMKSIQYQGTVSSAFKSFKSVYYRLFGSLYWFLGQFTDYVLVNSKWTRNHIIHQWGPKRIQILYPSVDMDTLVVLEKKKDRKRLIISIGQFRPEKRHIFQLEIAKEYFSQVPDSDYRFVLIGGCRNNDDEKLIQTLRLFIKKHENIFKGRVSLSINISYNELLDYLSKADLGLHTMKEEHFGIGIIEFMASGVIPIAHNSGGPKTDIIGPFSNDDNVGYLCDTKNEYVQSLMTLTTQLKKKDKQNLRSRAVQSVTNRFSERLFEKQFLEMPIFESIN